MAKIRVYELANSLGIEVERALHLLHEVGATPRNHMSVVERVPARRVRQLLKQNKNAALPPTQIQQASAPQQVEPPAMKAVDPEARETPAPNPQAQSSPPTAKEPDQQVAKSEAPASERVAKPEAKEAPAEAAPRAAQATPAKAQEKGGDAASDRPKAPETPKTTGAAPKAAASSQSKPKQPESQSPTDAKPAERRPTSSPQATRQSRPRTATAGTTGASQTSRTQSARPSQAESGRPAAARTAGAARPAARGGQARQGGGTTNAGGRPQGAQSGGARRQGGGRAATPPGVGRPGAPGTGQRRGRRRQASRASAAERQAREIEARRPTGPVLIPDSLTVQELAELLHVAPTSIIMSLMEAGVMAAINQRIEFEVASSVAEALGFEVTRPEKARATAHEEVDEPEENLAQRPPVVTIMGHVDHGKTTLLDVIRRAKVAEKEAGGITQHIGAYQIEAEGQAITFLDTPGHEAFTSMRSRGAQVTDIAILVVAADDGVMPQTVEAINHAKAAEVPIIIAINKMDRPGANPDRIKQQLADHELVPEEWGGETICVEVSALQHEGIDNLLEMVLLVAEMRELKANPNRSALGVVIDAELDKSRGPVATLLVQAGTLRVGESIVAGSVYGRVRAMFDESGQSVEEAGPSRPVGVLGLSDVPKAGDLIEVVSDDRIARQTSVERAEQERETDSQRGAGRIRLSEIHSKSQAGDVKDLNLLIKADVQGSVEALRQSVEKISSDEVRINVIHAAVGGINESDVSLAAASNAIIIGFNVRPEATARRAAEREDVEVRLYRVIYEAIEEIEAAMVGLLDPVYEEVVLGRAEVRALFRVPVIGVVAGCYVTEGKVVRHAEARLLRDHVVIHEGKLNTLRRFKDDVREVSEGYECGMSFERFSDIKEGDIIEAFRMEEVKRG